MYSFNGENYIIPIKERNTYLLVSVCLKEILLPLSFIGIVY
jgi:hypothetical protein